MTRSATFRQAIGLIGLALAVVGVAGPAHGQLAIERPIVDFADPDSRRQDVRISNTGDETLYIEIAPRLVRHPGTDREERVEIANPRERGLLVSPSKVVLEPGQRRLLRFSLLRRPEDTDRIFRVAVTPKVGDVQAETTGVRVMVGYNLLVIARPVGAEADLTGTRRGDRLTFRNRGSTNALLMRGRQCAPSGEPCEKLPTKRMYAGNSWTVELPYATETHWTIRTRDGVIERRW